MAILLPGTVGSSHARVSRQPSVLSSDVIGEVIRWRGWLQERKAEQDQQQQASAEEQQLRLNRLEADDARVAAEVEYLDKQRAHAAARAELLQQSVTEVDAEVRGSALPHASIERGSGGSLTVQALVCTYLMRREAGHVSETSYCTLVKYV